MKYSLFVFLFIGSLFTAQKISLISNSTKKPLANVFVFDKEGNLITTSDAEGTISKEDISKDSFYLLSYDNMITDTLKVKNLSEDRFIVSDKIVNIKPIVLAKKEYAKDYYLTGYFVSYVLMNKKLNCYSDGVVVYKINKAENKVSNDYVTQYRVYTLKDPQQKFKSVASFDLKMQMKIPQVDKLEKFETYHKNEKLIFNKMTNQEYEDILISTKAPEKKEVNFLGFSMNDFSHKINASFISGASLKNYPYNYLNKYTNSVIFSMKHKSEEKYNEILIYTEFIPISSSETKPEDYVNFSKGKSNYKNKYWEDAYFPKTLSLFNSFYKSDLEEQENNAK